MSPLSRLAPAVRLCWTCALRCLLPTVLCLSLCACSTYEAKHLFKADIDQVGDLMTDLFAGQFITQVRIDVGEQG